jgi:hypothetical protein
VIASAIPDAMLLPTDECFAQEVPEPVYDGLTCPNYALWDSNEAETGSRLTNGYCAMSLNSNHVVLNTMPNVFVDVGLPTVDV